jgi:hypothetical protein
VCSPYFKELFKVSVGRYFKWIIKLLDKVLRQNASNLLLC